MMDIAKTSSLGAALFLSATATVADANVTTAADFEFRVRSIKSNVSPRVPIPLGLVVTYKGKGATELTVLRPQFLAPAWRTLLFDGPKSWKKHKGSTIVHVSGIEHTVKLTKGQSMGGVVNLQDYFQTITPGKATVLVRLKLWPVNEKRDNPIILQTKISLNVKSQVIKSSSHSP